MTPGLVDSAMRFSLFAVLALTGCASSSTPGKALRAGSSPQLAMDATGTVRMVFGRGDTIFVASSRDSGATFTPAVSIAIVPEMHLGSTRGPVIASSRNQSLVSATDKKGNIHLFQLDQGSNVWSTRSLPLNTVLGSAPEGLGTLAADGNDIFYSAWLDYRDGKQMAIYFARIDVRDSTPPVNRRLYASPDGHVCECCRPSIATRDGRVAVMFRNWLGGARDLYLVQSNDEGASFGSAEKLGTGSWKLNACPTDGGSLSIDASGRIATVWRREMTIYTASPGEPEVPVANGKSPMMSSRDRTIDLVWQDGENVRLGSLRSNSSMLVDKGRLPQVIALTGGRALLAWEHGGTVYFGRFQEPGR